jgi:hypothetical protein
MSFRTPVRIGPAFVRPGRYGIMANLTRPPTDND